MLSRGKHAYTPQALLDPSALADGGGGLTLIDAPTEVRVALNLKQTDNGLSLSPDMLSGGNQASAPCSIEAGLLRHWVPILDGIREQVPAVSIDVTSVNRLPGCENDNTCHV